MKILLVCAVLGLAAADGRNGFNGGVPSNGYGAPPAPTNGYGAPPTPNNGYGAPPAPTNGYGAPPTPNNGYGAPPAPTNGYGAPPTPNNGYGAPPPSSNGNGAPAAPTNGYRAPVAPSNGYGAPPSNLYGAPNGGYGSVDPAIAALAENIPGGGVPGEDYPILASVPETGFSCDAQAVPGYYADTAPEAGCQVFHICQDRALRRQQDSFLCPNGTIFNQQYLVCDWWFNFDCSQAESFYSVNELLGVVPNGNGYGSNGNGLSNGYGAPAVPSNGYGAPAAPSNGYGAPAAPSNGYGVPAAPSNGYGAPAAPSNGYGAPAAPSNGYGAPSPSASYGAPF